MWSQTLQSCRHHPVHRCRCLQASAQATLTALAEQVGAAASLDRASRRAFATALATFVGDLRGAVCVR